MIAQGLEKALEVGTHRQHAGNTHGIGKDRQMPQIPGGEEYSRGQGEGTYAWKSCTAAGMEGM